MNTVQPAKQPAVAAQASTTFAELGLAPAALRVLEQRRIHIPTPIQHQAIPPVTAGHDVIGLAQTGTGKTLAFVLPTVIKLSGRSGMALILVPTRELAIQVAEVWKWFEQSMHVPATVVIGGANMHSQVLAIRRQPRCIIATPGRLLDHLRQRTVRLDSVNTVILDEADRMFDMGFAPQIKDIMKHVPPIAERQTLLFSATMPEAIVKLVKQNMRTPVSIEVARSGTTSDTIEQEFVVVKAEEKLTAVLELLGDPKITALIFTRTKHGAKRLTQTLRAKNWKTEELHSNRSLQQRKMAVQAVQQKRSRILVATDIAARGIDIPHLDIVVNYDLPEQAEDYVHRIGRAGRAGRTGKAVSLVTIDQTDLIRRIQRFVTKPMQQRTLQTVSAQTLPERGSGSHNASGFRSRRFGGSRPGRGGSSGHSRHGSRGGRRPYHTATLGGR